MAVDEEFLKKIRNVVRKRRKNKQGNSSSTQSRSAALERLLRSAMELHAFEDTINAAVLEFTDEGRHEEVQVLLDFEADPDYRESYNGRTLLHVAVDRGDAKMVEILLRSEASVSETYCDKTPLLRACMNEDQDCAKTLLEFGADPNTRYNEELNTTPLMMLVEEQKSLEILVLLLENGADPNLESYYGSLELELYRLIGRSLRYSAEGLSGPGEYAVKVVRLLLRFRFRPLCCGEKRPECLLKLSLQHFSRIFSLALLLLEPEEPFEPEHQCWSRFEVLREALQKSVQSCSEAKAHSVLDKANALLDQVRVKPSLVRFTLTPGAPRDHQETVWVVDTVTASLQSLCRAVVCSSLLPSPLEPKIQALNIPDRIKDLLMPGLPIQDEGVTT